MSNNNIKKRTVINAVALYGKIIINVFVAFFTTKIVLEFLGKVDFGLYSLIGGVVAMLSFLNGALLQSTQRYLSVAIGKEDKKGTQQIFNSGFGLHILMSIILVLLFLGAKPFLFNGFLKIPPDRINAAINTYYLVIATTSITFFTIPYNAAINAREEMWFFAITDVLMSLMKLGSAILIMFINDNSGDLLVIYTGGIMLSTLIVLVIKAVWSNKRYFECQLVGSMLWNWKQMKDQLGFTGWNTLVTIAVLFRNQGIAVVLNVFFGPVINAAYGLANQINSLVANFSTTLSTVFAPQIIQSYGSENRERMLRLTIFSSKITLLMSTLLGFPFLLESRTVLVLWLNEVPEYASILCKLVIILFIISQFYPGLVRALYAEGNIKLYQITVSVLLIIPVLIGYGLFELYDFEPQVILYLMIVGQIIALISTIQFAKVKVGLDAKHFYVSSVLKPIIIFVGTFAFVYVLKSFIDSGIMRILFVILCTSILLALQFYLLVFTKEEREQFESIYKKIW
ncbi:hypothetical protein [Zunongwangia sp.]|uniref:hypothetical protein n=1 Tax=Zunongwangia sp. TaxID=1965325 RepID=UPI003AA9B59A